MKIFHTKKLLFAVFLPGIILGLLYVKLIAKDCVADVAIFTESFIHRYGAADFAARDFLLYLLPLRLIPFLILLCLMFTDMRKTACIFAQMWTGFTLGVLLAAAGAQSGISGVLFCAAGLFPQFLLYIPAYMVVIWYGYTFPTNRWNAQKTLFVLAAMLLGILLEGYVSPYLMRIIFKIFKQI